jgi:predicted GNAT family N-acyltransferase
VRISSHRHGGVTRRPVDQRSVTVVSGPPPPAAAALRNAVFVGEQGVDAALEFDDRDATADHAVVFDSDGEQVLATARLLDPGDGPADSGGDGAAGEPVGTIGRVAVRSDLRGSGLGLAVMRALEARAAARGLVAISIHAQLAVEDFYLRQGYVSHGEHFVEAGIEHVAMRKELLPGVREAVDDDSEALIRLIGEAWAAYPGCVLDVDAEEPWLRAPASAYRLADGGYDGRLWVVPAPDGGVLASVAVRQPPPVDPVTDLLAGHVELKSLYVATAARRRGLATGLVHRVEREARRRGATRVVLWSDTRFTEAHALYARLGYKASGRSRELDDLSHTTELEFVRSARR